MPERNFIKFPLTVAAVIVAAATLYSQPKSAGVVFSYNGLEVCYEHAFPEYQAFIDCSLKTEMSEYLAGRKNYPGFSGSIVWKISIMEWYSSEGNTLRFYAGPGIMAGYGADYKVQKGVFFGLKGSIGGECDFLRNVSISLSISPVIGSHITMQEEHFSMLYYRNGLIYGLVPEIGIKYRF